MNLIMIDLEVFTHAPWSPLTKFCDAIYAVKSLLTKNASSKTVI